MGREHALYAVDLEDAVNAAFEMARKRAAAACKFALWIFLFHEVQKLTTDGPANLEQLSCAQDAQRMSERTHTELRIARAYVKLLCIPEDSSEASVSLASIGNCEIRMFQGPEADFDGIPLFWLACSITARKLLSTASLPHQKAWLYSTISSRRQVV